MAQGDLRGTLTGSVASITNPLVASGSVSVSVGDLIFGTVSQQTNLTATDTVTDNLGNTYTFVNAGTDAGTVTIRSFYSRVTEAGTLTDVSVPATASTNDASIVVAVIEGPFLTSPLDANPANVTDSLNPFVTAATGTLAQANEVVMGAIAIANNQTISTTSPAVISGTVARNNASVGQSRKVVSSTSSVDIEFTGTNGVSGLLIASFKLDPNQTVSPALFSDSDTFFAATITTGSVTVSPALFSNEATFFAATITTTYTISPALFENSATFFAATVSQSGSQPWTPDNLTTVPVVWYSAQRSSITHSSNIISSVENLGSLADSWDQTVEDDKPTYDATGWDGTLPSIEYAPNDFLQIDWTHTGNRLAIFFAADTSAGGDGRIVNCRDASAGWQNIGNTQVVRQDATNYKTVRNVTDTSFSGGDGKHIVGVIHGASGASARTDGGSATTTSVVDSFDFDRVRTGAEDGDNNGVTGAIAEVILLDYEPTTDERQKIEGYLAWEWGIEANLPAGHPYENERPTVGGSNQTVSPALFSNSNTFFAATITTTITVSAALFENTNTFFAATITATYTINPSIFTDDDTFFAATITVGAATISPALFENLNTFNAATITTTVSISTALFEDADTFFSATVLSQYTVLTTTFVDDDTFFSTTITTGSVTIEPTTFVDGDTFFAANVSQTEVQNVDPALFVDTDTFFAATITTTNTIDSSTFVDGDTFFAATITTEAVVAPAIFVDSDDFFSATIIQQQFINPATFVNSQQFYPATITDADSPLSLADYTYYRRRRRA